jgi:hypothetical protein
MDWFNVAYNMNGWFNVSNNMDEWMVWHIIVAVMCWREIQSLNYSFKLLEMNQLTELKISWHPNYNHIIHPSMDEGIALI